MKFFWIRTNLIDFASPVRHGEAFLPLDVFSPTFQFDPACIDLEYDLSGDQSYIKPDISEWVPGTLLLSQRACDALYAFLDNCIIHPVTWGADRYHLVFIRIEIDAFDLSRSTYQLWNAETKSGVFRVKNIKHLLLSERLTESEDIFRLHGSLTLKMEIIVSIRIKELYDTHSLTGLWFYPAN